MKTINELLARWAELESKMCMQTGSWFQLTSGGMDVVIPIGWHQKMILQYAVQQAVESRGWGWQVHASKDKTLSWDARVYNGVGKIGYVFKSSAEGPAHALLAAYIKALEAVLFAAGPGVVPDGVSRDEWERLYNAGNGVGFEDAEVA